MPFVLQIIYRNYFSLTLFTISHACNRDIKKYVRWHWLKYKYFCRWSAVFFIFVYLVALKSERKVLCEFFEPNYGHFCIMSNFGILQHLSPLKKKKTNQPIVRCLIFDKKKICWNIDILVPIFQLSYSVKDVILTFIFIRLSRGFEGSLVKLPFESLALA